MCALYDRTQSDSESDVNFGDFDVEKSSGWNESTEFDFYIKNKGLNNQIIKKANKILLLSSIINKYNVSWIEPPNPTGWRKANCPFNDHSDSSPSFGFSESRGVFNCFGCNRNGCTVQFISFMENRLFLDVAKEIICRYQSPDEIISDIEDSKIDEIDELLLSFSQEIRDFLYKHPNSAEALDYIERLTWNLDVYLWQRVKRGNICFKSIRSRIEKLQDYLNDFRK